MYFNTDNCGWGGKKYLQWQQYRTDGPRYGNIAAIGTRQKPRNRFQRCRNFFCIRQVSA